MKEASGKGRGGPAPVLRPVEGCPPARRADTQVGPYTLPTSGPADGKRPRRPKSVSGIIHIKTADMIKVTITGSESWQAMALNQGGSNRVGRKQLVARYQAIGGLHDILVHGKHL